MMRKLAAAVLLTLALAGCGFAEPFDDGDGKRIRLAVEELFGELERADYATAASHWCAYEPPANPPTAGQLEATFGGHPRPWKTKLVSSQHTRGGTGVANLTLTDGTGAQHPFNVDYTMAGGGPKVCSVDTGTVSIDVD